MDTEPSLPPAPPHPTPPSSKITKARTNKANTGQGNNAISLIHLHSSTKNAQKTTATVTNVSNMATGRYFKHHQSRIVLLPQLHIATSKPPIRPEHTRVTGSRQNRPRSTDCLPKSALYACTRLYATNATKANGQEVPPTINCKL